MAINEENAKQAMPFKEQMAVFKRILSFTKPVKWQFAGGIFFGILLAITNAVLPRIIQIFIDDHLTAQTATTQTIVAFSGIYMAVTFFKMVVWYLNLYMFNIASEKTVKNIRETLFTKIHSFGMRFFDQTSSGWIVTRVTNDTEALKDFWQVLLTILQSIFGFMISLIAMLLLDVKVTLWIVAFIPILVYIMLVYQKRSSKTYIRMKAKLSKLNSQLAESVNGMSVIQQFRQEKRLREEFEETSEAHFSDRFSMTKLNALLLGPVSNFLRALAIIAILAAFGYDALQNPINVGMIYAFTTYSDDLFKPLSRMMDSLSMFQDGLVSSSRILLVLDTEEYVPEQTPLDEAMIKDAKIEFKNVSFSYDGKNDVLKNISFTVEPGQTIALIGHTGSGKSSIINVLMRFYEFHSGDVLIDGVSIRNFPIQDLRENIGLVLQDSFLFYGTINDNIRLKNKAITDAQIRQAAEFVQADKFIEKLPNGYESLVVERGASYSSGQKQLVSFASTIVKEPKILILDEATANIDTETEALIQKGLERMRENRTTVAIAHRLSTIRDADTILVLDQGRIIERGNHDELIVQGGVYKDMYELQNLGMQTS